MGSQVTKSSNEDKIKWLTAHPETWVKIHDTQAMIDNIAEGFVEAGLIVSTRNASAVSILKLVSKTSKRMREAARA